jgi:hypothetical protein
VCREFDVITKRMGNLKSVTFLCGTTAGGGMLELELRDVLERNGSTVKCLTVKGTDKEGTDFFVVKLL